MSVFGCEQCNPPSSSFPDSAMRRFPALSLFSGHRGHPGLSAVPSVGEECTLAPGTVRMETAVQAAHWYVILSPFSLFPSLFLSCSMSSQDSAFSNAIWSSPKGEALSPLTHSVETQLQIHCRFRAHIPAHFNSGLKSSNVRWWANQIQNSVIKGTECSYWKKSIN